MFWNLGTPKINPLTLSDMLHKRLGGHVPARGFRTIRASAVTNQYTAFCPREVALLDILKRKPKDEYLTVATQVAFAQGESLHKLAREVWFNDISVGHWACNHCGNVTWFSKRPKVKCTQCGHPEYSYLEVQISGDKDIHGSLDMLVDEGDGQHVLVEIKTMDKDQHKELVAPLAEHRIRTNLYLHLLRTSESPYVDFVQKDFARVLYISKGYGSKSSGGPISPFKDYLVMYDPKSLPFYLSKAEEVKTFRQEGTIPQRICTSGFIARAKQCSCMAECWSDKFPAGSHHESPGD
jgi:hypothetical protein